MYNREGYFSLDKQERNIKISSLSVQKKFSRNDHFNQLLYIFLIRVNEVALDFMLEVYGVLTLLLHTGIASILVILVT